LVGPAHSALLGSLATTAYFPVPFVIQKLTYGATAGPLPAGKRLCSSRRFDRERQQRTQLQAIHGRRAERRLLPPLYD
jgi:hypothetical protein